MPIAPTYPGVYIEELPSGVHTIVGVSTSVTAFLGYFKRGPMNKATQIFSVADLERNFGALDAQSDASYAIRQFFLNGGTEAWVVRVASGSPVASSILVKDDASGGAAVMSVSAASGGTWGDNVRVEIDHGTIDPTKYFNLVVSEMDFSGPAPRVANMETFRNLSLDSTDPRFAPAVVKDGSTLISLDIVGTPTTLPAATGTTGQDISALNLTTALNEADPLTVTLDDPVAGATALGSVTLAKPLPTTVAQLAPVLQKKIQTLLKTATVSVVSSAKPIAPATTVQQFLQVRAGAKESATILQLGGALATTLGLDAAARTNVQQYAPGSAFAAGAQALPGAPAAQVKGADGGLPDATALAGDEAAKTGFYALEDVDIFNILCLPDVMNLTDSAASGVVSEAEAYCEKRRAFFILDVPQADQVRDQVAEIKTWLDQNGTLRHKNAALYYPRPLIPDRLNGYRPKAVAPSGTVAGLYARTDAERGVWKAPAGTEASLRGVRSLEYKLTDPENGTLNPSAINCLRSMPVFGNICWGARTLEGDDQLASEWKYIPVRRTALFLEESLYRGLKWVVFEPNDEPLWAQIRLNVGAFMHDLFRQGAFQGTTPKEAYFVKCDKDTTTQNDIDRGVVNVLVGFAPLKPAEFVVVQIQQMAGQIAT